MPTNELICDIVVIGAGIAGASLAYELSKDADVILLEGEHIPGYHTTGRSAAYFLPFFGGEKIFPLTKASEGFLLRPPHEFSENGYLSKRGSLHIAREEQRDHLRAYYERVHDKLPNLEIKSTAEILSYCPLLNPEYAAEGLYDPNCYDIDVSAFHQAYLKRFKERGGRLETNFLVNSIEWSETKGQWYVRSGDRCARASLLVNAAGAWGDEIAQMANVDPIGLTPLRRTLCHFDYRFEGDDMRKDAPVLVDAEEKFYFRQESGALLASPCDETPSPPCDCQPEEEDVARIAFQIEEATQVSIRGIKNKWAGLRTFSPDRVLTIGFESRRPSFFWCVGQGGFGIQTAPGAAQLARSLIMGTTLNQACLDAQVEPEIYSPRRFR